MVMVNDGRSWSLMRPFVKEHDHVASRRKRHAGQRLAVEDFSGEGDVALSKQAVVPSSPQAVLVVPQQGGRRTLKAVDFFEGHRWPRQVPYVQGVEAISLVATVVVRCGAVGCPLALRGGRRLPWPPSHGGHWC